MEWNGILCVGSRRLCLADEDLATPRIFLTRAPKRLIEIQASRPPYETGDSLPLAVIQEMHVLQQ